MFIKKNLKISLAKIAKNYAEDTGHFWGDEDEFFIKKKEFIFIKNYLVFNKRYIMESNYVVTIDKKH